ncbi:hypothetical protein [Deinococcus sp.]|uniref:hypothetical protein n=1 Tax=Deinococcus sp. TaxID=47478 RepID=UPI003C7CEA2E
MVAANGPEHLAGVLPTGRPAQVPAALSGMKVQPIQVSRPILLSVTDGRELAQSHVLNLNPTGTVNSQVQLSGWIISR